MESVQLLLEAAGHRDINRLRFREMQKSDWSAEFFRGYRLVIVQDIHASQNFFVNAIGAHKGVAYMPVLFFNGLTPDDAKGLMALKNMSGKGFPVSSGIAMGALRNGLSIDEAHSLYSPDFCNLLGYGHAYQKARENLISQISDTVPNIASLLEDWKTHGVFYHMSLHPKLYVIEDILRSVLKNQVNLELPLGLSKFFVDPLQKSFVSPQLNHVNATDLFSDPEHHRKHGGKIFSCRQFIELTYNKLSGEFEALEADKAGNKIFDQLLTKKIIG